MIWNWGQSDCSLHSHERQYHNESHCDLECGCQQCAYRSEPLLVEQVGTRHRRARLTSFSARSCRIRERVELCVKLKDPRKHSVEQIDEVSGSELKDDERAM